MTDISLPWTGEPVRVGLVGAGPWARAVHARVLAAGPETRLTSVWARREEAARETAAPYGADVAADFDELLEGCEAVAFSVPPAIQAELALRAVKAGKALLLEKPLGGICPRRGGSPTPSRRRASSRSSSCPTATTPQRAASWPPHGNSRWPAPGPAD